MGGGPFQRYRLAWGVREGQNEVMVDAVGKNDGRGGRHCSRWLVWQSWESRNCVAAVDGGGDGGGG